MQNEARGKFIAAPISAMSGQVYQVARPNWSMSEPIGIDPDRRGQASPTRASKACRAIQAGAGALLNRPRAATAYARRRDARFLSFALHYLGSVTSRFIVRRWLAPSRQYRERSGPEVAVGAVTAAPLRRRSGWRIVGRGEKLFDPEVSPPRAQGPTRHDVIRRLNVPNARCARDAVWRMAILPPLDRRSDLSERYGGSIGALLANGGKLEVCRLRYAARKSGTHEKGEH
jgi:hypothetical protein